MELPIWPQCGPASKGLSVIQTKTVTITENFDSREHCDILPYNYNKQLSDGARNTKMLNAIFRAAALDSVLLNYDFRVERNY